MGGTIAAIGAGTGCLAEVRERARQVVNVTFLATLLQAMRRTVPRTGLVDGGRGEEIFRRQLDLLLVDRMSERLDSPLTDALLRQLGFAGESRRGALTCGDCAAGVPGRAG